MAEQRDFDLLAASLRADAVDVGAFVEALATKLELSFPDCTRVARAGLMGKKRVRRIEVELGDGRYELEHESGAVATRRRSVVRGISLKSEELPLEDWIDSLSAQLVAAADASERGRAALERLLER